MKSLSRQEVRGIDAYAVGTLGIAGVVLMENAGRQAADVACLMLCGCASPEPGPRAADWEICLSYAPYPPKIQIVGKKVAVVAGAGNNGGDGFVVARHLCIRGARVETFLVSPRDKISGDAAINLGILERLGCDVRDAWGDEAANLAQKLEAFDLVVDAVGGTGVTGPLRDGLHIAVEQINAARRPVLAIDIPTGLDCDTGLPTGPCVRADITVTFAARKKGFDAPGAQAFTGMVWVADIGVPAAPI
jgi:NAD(P)H-hydrate epimerase